MLPCHHRHPAMVALAVSGVLAVAFDLRIVGLLVVWAGFTLAGYGLAAAIVPARTVLDRLLATITFAVAVLAVVAELLSLATLLGSPSSWIAGAVLCGVTGGWVRRDRPQCLVSYPGAIRLARAAGVAVSRTATGVAGTLTGAVGTATNVADAAAGVAGGSSGVAGPSTVRPALATGAINRAPTESNPVGARFIAPTPDLPTSNPLTSNPPTPIAPTPHSTTSQSPASHSTTSQSPASHPPTPHPPTSDLSTFHPPASIAPTSVVPRSLALASTGRLFVWLLGIAVGLHLLTVFILSWFSGITVFDTISHYLPRSIRFLQNGTFGTFTTYYDFMQYLHQTLVAVQVLFLRSDVLVNPSSFVAASLMCVGIYVLARSLGWPAPYPLLAALAPLSMPILLLHASTSNFDTFTGLWIVLTLYFLRRAFATTDRGWLLVAAAATALAFASKPTSWFAMPGLGLLWLVLVGRAALRGRLRRAVPALAACTVILVLVGMPFLLRNTISRGYLVAPPQWQDFQLGGSATGPEHRVRLLAFNTLALGLQLVTPPFLLPASTANSLDGWFTARAQALGYQMPDPSITVHTEWPGLIRHVSHRYDSNHAGLGAAFVLVTLPSLLALPFARRRLGPRWWYAVGLAVVGLSYFVVLNVVSIYSVNNIRYLIEMMAAVAALGPALFVLLPRRVGGTLALVVATVLVFEMHDVVDHNKQVPPDLVMQVPRNELYYVINGNPPTPARAAALLDQKYPPDEVPDLWIEDSGTPSFPDYTFLGSGLMRRTHYLKPPASPAYLPGPYVTPDRSVAERLAATGLAVADQLSVDFWIVFPNDRPRLLFWAVRPADAPMQLRIQAVVPPGSVREPRYAFALRTSQGEEQIRPFGPSPVIEIPLETASRGTIQVTIRDGVSNQGVERLRLERARYMGI